MSVIEEIADERKRQQVEEGWDAAHDDAHQKEELARAAVCYAASGAGHLPFINLGMLWPWKPSWWKPKNPRRDLIRAAALIVAEIERMDRKP